MIFVNQGEFFSVMSVISQFIDFSDNHVSKSQ